MEHHSTKDCTIDRSLGGARVRIANVKGAITKNNVVAATVFKSGEHTDGEIWREFFKQLDEGMVHTQQGGIVHCDKKIGYYVDLDTAFPKGICGDPKNSGPDQTCLKFKTHNWQNGITRDTKITYHSVIFDNKLFPAGCDTVAKKARYVKDNINTMKSTTGYLLFEYQMDLFEKIPVVDQQMVKKNIQVLSFSSFDRIAKTSIRTSNDEKPIKVDVVLPPNIATNYYNSVYAYYIAKLIEETDLVIDGGFIRYDSINKTFKSVKIVEKTPDSVDVETKPIIKKADVIVDPESEEAVALIGKKVYASNSYNMNDFVIGRLDNIKFGRSNPFDVVISTAVQSAVVGFTFIKEAPKPKVVCYDLEDKNVRRSLFNRIYVSNDEEGCVTSFSRVNDRWLINGKLTSYKLMTDYTWDDGSPCGVEKEGECEDAE